MDDPISILMCEPLALWPAYAPMVHSLVEKHLSGDYSWMKEPQVKLWGSSPQAQNRNGGGVAVLPLDGILIPRGSALLDFFGATSLELFRSRFQRAMLDKDVSSIVLAIDSPGGSVAGVGETADLILNSRGRKPILASASYLAASAAYWIATAADKLYVSPSGQVGSIGVYALHEDLSKKMDMEGVKTTLISAGKYKAEGNPLEPLSAEGRAYIQARVNEMHEEFVNAVARGRGVSASTVRTGFGEGRVVGAKQAIAQGMVDGQATLDAVIGMALSGQSISSLAGRRLALQTPNNSDLRQRRLATEYLDLQFRRLKLARRISQN